MPQNDLKTSAKELTKLKNLYDKTKNEMARIEGRIESLTEQLQSHGLSSVIAAKKEIRKLEAEIDSMSSELNERLNDIQRKMPDVSTTGT